MPPVVDGEEVVRGPTLFVAAHPGDALVDPALHLEHVGDRVLGPRIARVQCHRLAPALLGPVIFAALLEAERVHAEKRVKVAIGVGPMRQHHGDTVAQAPGIAEQEIPQMGDLDRDEIAWMVDHNFFQELMAAAEVARDERPERRRMGLFAFVQGEVADLRQRCLGDRHAGLVGTGEVQMPAGEVGHGEGRTVGGRLGETRHRVADIERELLGRGRIVLKCPWRCARDPIAVTIDQHRPSLRTDGIPRRASRVNQAGPARLRAAPVEVLG